MLIYPLFFLMVSYFFIPGDNKPRQNEQKEFLYIGTFTGKNEPGVFVYQFNRKNAELKLIQQLETLESPSYLELHPNGEFLYTVNREGIRDDQNWGSVSAYSVDRASGKIKHLNDQPAYGSEPCHITIDSKGRMAFIANYTSGNVVAYSINKNGHLSEKMDSHQHSGSSVNEKRQQGPHAHCTMLSPDDNFLYVVDLGIDKIKTYKVDYTRKKLIPMVESDGKVDPGAGPRHITFTPDGRYAYVIEELASGITAFRVNKSTGNLESFQRISTVPDGYDGTNYCADIHVSPDGKYLYGSNRGHDSLIICSINKKTGELDEIGIEPTLGKWPRNFLIDPEGEYIFAANQNSDNLVIFHRDPKSGMLTPTDTEVSIPKPVCIKISAK